MTVRMHAVVGLLLSLGVSGCAKDYKIQSVVNTSQARAIPYLVRADSTLLGDVQVINPYTYNPARLDPDKRVSGSSGEQARQARLEREKQLADAREQLRQAEQKSTRADEEMINQEKKLISQSVAPSDLVATKERAASAKKELLALQSHTAALQAEVKRLDAPPLYDIASDTALSDQVRKQARNALIEAIIAASDDNVDVHLAGLKATESNVNLVFGAAAIGLTGGAAVTSGAVAKALAAASTGVQGARALVNEEVYAQALAESIVTLVKATRKDQADKLRARFGEDMVTFPMEQGIALALEYHNTASAYNGLALARQAIEHEAIRKRGDEGPNGLGSPEEQLAAAKKNLVSMQLELASKEETKKSLEAIVAKKTSDQATFTKDGVEWKKLQTEIDGLNSQIDDLKKQIAKVNENIAAKKAVISKLIELATQRLSDEKAALDKQAGTDQSKSPN